MRAIELPFHELMKLFERAKQRTGFGDDVCICGQFGATGEHMCNMRYYIIENQIDCEIANFPPYPNPQL